MVASLISGASTFCAQPVISTTRFFRCPPAGCNRLPSRRDAGGRLVGAISSIAFSGPENRFFAGCASFAPNSEARKSMGRGSTTPSTVRRSRSKSGRL